MRRRSWAIIGITVPLVLFGIMVLLIANNVNQMFSNSERWMVELEPNLNLSEQQLSLQIQDEDLKQLRIYRIQPLEEYFGSLTPNLEKQFEAVIDTDHRFVFYVDKNSGYSDEQIHEIFTEIDYIIDAKDLHDWLLR